MKKYKDFSLKTRIPFLLGTISLLVLSAICVLLLMPLRSNALKNSSRIAQLTAIESGERLSQKISSAASVVRAYSGVVEEFIGSDIIPNGIKRELLVREINSILAKEKDMSNIWCTLEPNVLDGMDADFAGRVDMGSNLAGEFAPWVAYGELSASEGDYEEDFYLMPKTTLREHITEPYWDEVNGEKEHMFSIIVPIVVYGKFQGVIGTDYDVSKLIDVIDINSQGVDGRLVTNQGTIAVCHDFDQIGNPAETENREILYNLSLGKMMEGIYSSENGDVYKVYTPVRLGASGIVWFYAVDIPYKKIYADARQTAVYLIVYFLIGVLLIALTGWFVVQPMLKNIKSVTEIIQQLSLGRLQMNIDKKQNQDEVGTMKHELWLLVEGLKQMSEFANKIGKGNLNAEYRMLSDDDALGGSLLEMRQSLQKAQKEQSIRDKEEEQRNWGTAGLAKFAEILRQDNNDLEALSYHVISNLVKYLGINQGGIFVMNEAENEEDRVLEMKACYAFDRKKYTEKKIHPGEGLVGTCFLEGEMIYMTEVPDSYITITSGLGNANPKAILISPLKVNDQIYGVVELASFHQFEPYQIDFVQKVSESIAATISSVNVNIRTSRLLAQTKLQAEEMANQEEELRQNMEEMQATQEEARRREIELQDTLARLQEVHDSEY